MSMVSKFALPFFITGALALGGIGMVPAAQAGTAVAPEAGAAATCTKQAAITKALQRVGGGTVVSAVLEKEDATVHWSIDIVKAPFEYEVWVKYSNCTVIRVIQQPL